MPPTIATGPSFAEVESALAAVRRVLDKLTALGHDAAAFEVARAQYAASIRNSWPGNLATLVSSLERVAADERQSLDDDERADLARAITTLARVQHA